MHWTDSLYDAVESAIPGGYFYGGPTASEPTAWSALSLAMAGRADASRRGADWLANIQQDSGSVGVMADHETPAWPTSLAILAWKALQGVTQSNAYQANIDRATQWAIQSKGLPTKRNSLTAHDTSIIGWSWAEDTHSWLEPTAMFVQALRAVGLADHPRAREGVRLLVDRLLPSGGANYGNTIVLGQELRAHVQPTGIALWALGGESIDDPRLPRTVELLTSVLDEHTATASLAFGVLGLTAHDARPDNAERWLRAAYERLPTGRPSLQKLALLAMASAAPVGASLAAAR